MSRSDRQLATVPPATHAQAGISGKQSWQGDYNVACWVRARGGLSPAATLLLRYVDAGGEREVVVDRAVAAAAAGGVLLAGRLTLRATGRIEQMSVWLRLEPDSDVAVDELYVQRVGLAADSAKSTAAR